MKQFKLIGIYYPNSRYNEKDEILFTDTISEETKLILEKYLNRSFGYGVYFYKMGDNYIYFQEIESKLDKINRLQSDLENGSV